MKLLIDIPKEFEQHFQMDRFEDSLNRLSADAHLLAGLYEQETASMLIEAFKNAILVPPHGDLIDRDMLRKVMFIGEQCLYSWDELEDAIDYAPTIIEAEEDE